MEGIKELLLDVQSRLQQEIPDLWTDKDWGQFRYQNPPVKFPCALLDVESIQCSNIEKGAQIIEADIILTLANQRLKPTSVSAPNKGDGYLLLDLLESLNKALQMHHQKWYAPLIRKSVRRIYYDNASEVYSVTYGTTFISSIDSGERKQSARGVKVSVNPVTEGIEFMAIEDNFEVEHSKEK